MRWTPSVAGYMRSIAVCILRMCEGFSNRAFFSEVRTGTFYAPGREMAVEGAMSKTLAIVTLRNGVTWSEILHR